MSSNIHGSHGMEGSHNLLGERLNLSKKTSEEYHPCFMGKLLSLMALQRPYNNEDFRMKDTEKLKTVVEKGYMEIVPHAAVRYLMKTSLSKWGILT